MADINLGPITSFDDPGSKVVEIGGVEIGVFRLGDAVFAYENLCPHLGGPVCQGRILPLTLEGVEAGGTSVGRVQSQERTNVICPWHGYEFDIRTGEHPTKPGIRLRRIAAGVVDGNIVLTLPGM